MVVDITWVFAVLYDTYSSIEYKYGVESGVGVGLYRWREFFWCMSIIIIFIVCYG